MYFLALLFVIFIPLIEGALLALLLREVYVRHPLPLGGTIEIRQKPFSPQSAETTEIEEIAQKITAESTETAHEVARDNGNIPEDPNMQAAPAADAPSNDADVPMSLADPASEQSEAQHSGVSVFDGAENIPQNLPINNLIESMTAEASVVLSNDLENRIEASALPTSEIPEELHTVPDEINHEELHAMAESFPKTTIDFSQELEIDSELADAVSSMAKELLGENFDFDALEKQSQQAKQSIKFPAPAENADENDSAEIALDVQEDESGTVQVSSPFVANTTPQLTDFTVPQTVFSTFSGDWIQEANSTTDEMMVGEPSRFCYTEESRPMFVRRNKIG